MTIISKSRIRVNTGLWLLWKNTCMLLRSILHFSFCVVSSRLDIYMYSPHILVIQTSDVLNRWLMGYSLRTSPIWNPNFHSVGAPNSMQNAVAKYGGVDIYTKNIIPVSLIPGWFGVVYVKCQSAWTMNSLFFIRTNCFSFFNDSTLSVMGTSV